jgi:beta-glucosidase
MPPGGGGLSLALRVEANMARAHAAAYRLIHELQPQARVGYALNYRPVAARRRWFPLDALMARIRHTGLNLAFPSAISTGVMNTPLGNIKLPAVKGTQDYVGLNYYTVETAWFDLLQPQELFTRAGYPRGSDLSEHGDSANKPHGLYGAIRWAAQVYPGMPILITENGVESSDDAIRPRYIAQHLHQIWRALNFNWQVKAYFHWTLVDNFEWERGWSRRFGLWELDVTTQKRTKRRSAHLYEAVCRANALSSDMVRQYCPEVFDKIFPPFDG